MKENQHNMLQGNPQSNGSNLIDELREIIEKKPMQQLIRL